MVSLVSGTLHGLDAALLNGILYIKTLAPVAAGQPPDSGRLSERQPWRLLFRVLHCQGGKPSREAQ